MAIPLLHTLDHRPPIPKTHGTALLPFGTSLHTAKSATVLVNGQRIIIPGRLVTAAEKSRLANQHGAKQ